MAKSDKAKTDEGLPLGESVTEDVTYTPGPLDPVTVKWGPHVFQANVPKSITGHPDGTDRERANHHLIERARENKHFTVGGVRKRREPETLPKTAEEYRAYMVSWLKDPAIEHVDQLIGRFARDRDLQVVCEVGHDDFAWLSTLFLPKLHELQRADELNDMQVAAIWISHGINQVPWSA